ncbi:MAG: hypothetical protein ACLPKI_14290 [Streptosporangiaceae bacterium]
MAWFWLNIPLCTLIFAAVSGIPLWMVIKHPDTGPAAPAAASGSASQPRPVALAAAPGAAPAGHLPAGRDAAAPGAVAAA